MDIVEKVRNCISKWRSGGDLECQNILIPSHCNPSDSGSTSILTTAYHTLLSATLTTWSPKNPLPLDAFVTFVQSISGVLPSTSSSSTSTSSNANIFGEQLVDMIWSLDVELDEILADVKATIANCGEQSSDRPNPVVVKSNKVKQNVEADKATLAVIVKRLLSHRILDANTCCERFDSAILESTGLITDKSSFDKKEIRTRTGLFYKQNKFNLLREQSEGYSKLTVELTSSLGPGHSPATARPTETYASIQERARPVWEKIISLIGYFDLDPNKALDIILDVLSVNLASHYTFFIALLSCSPWSRSACFNVSDVEPMPSDPTPGRFQGKSLDEILTLSDSKGIVDTESMQKGSRVLAQVLGFKFTFYHSSEASEPPPKSLYLTAALLIREGFITLEDLYPHLSPSDPDMEKVHAAYLKNVQTRILAARMSQLAMAAPLESTAPSASKPKTETPTPEQKRSPEPRDPPNQKAGILIALLSIGALKPAMSILSKFPWLVDAQPEIADLVIRIMKVSISSLYDSFLITKERNPSFTQSRSRYGTTGMLPPVARKSLLTLWAPTPPSTNTTEFVFFFPDWTEKVPICTCLDDLIDVIEPFMRFIGLHVSRDPLFLTKYMRLGRAQIHSTAPIDPVTKKPIGEPDPDNYIRQFWFRILRQYLLPALPLIRGNAVCTVEIWNIIRQYETTARWRLYGEWRSVTYKSHPELRIREVQADRESKGILRRLSHKTIDSLAGPVAKLAHSNPCIFFSNAVNQIMAYDNLAAVVIQALRYVTNMGFEVLIFIILDAFANPHKERVKDDGVNTSDWLQSLASFAGMLFRRYSADLTPMLKYVVHQLYKGQTTEIVVLRELIWKMAGIEPLPSLSDSQIQAMAGGPALRIESIASSTRGARLDPGDAVLKGPSRLGRALMESSLALPLLIQVAQQRQSSVFLARDTHLKSLASLYDTTHGVLLQYLELLTSPSVISAQDYADKILPPLGDLSQKYGICAPICMQIIRPVLHSQLLTAALEMQEQEKIANEEAEKRLKAALKTKREPSVSQSRVASPVGNPNTPDSTEPRPADAATANEDVSMEAESIPAVAVPESPWLPQLEALFEDVKKTIPAQAYDVLGPGFYITFWQLSTYDLSPPAAKYDEEGAALRMLSRQEDGKYVASERAAERVRRQMAGTHRARRDRYNSFVQTLAQEFKEQTVSRAFTIRRLSREKQYWFNNVTNAAQKQTQALLLLDTFMEHCIQPRCLLSPMDADFCAQFIKVLHTLGTPGFHTVACYDKILSDQVKVILFSCSEYEARNYGRFLLGVLADLHKWHSDEQAYIQDNRSKVGGKTVLHTGFQRQYRLPMPSENHLKWPDYQRVVRKWHKKIALAFVECVQTGEFMHVYNAIIVLKEILPYFPLSAVSQESGTQLDRAMDQFLEKEERGDLKILGRAYSASLKKREQHWAPTKAPGKPSVSTASPRPTGPAADKPRSSAPTTGPSSLGNVGADIKRAQPALSSAPSGPRAQLANSKAASQPAVAKTIIQNGNIKAVPQPVESKSAIQPTNENNVNGVQAPSKSAMDSVPRPPVVKRVRPDTNGIESKPPGETRPIIADKLNTSDRKDDTKTATVLKDSPLRGPRSGEDKIPDSQTAMPPPSAPSQTHSAQELRETAKQSMTKTDDKTGRSTDPLRSQNGSGAPSPRHRSPSPSSRPGTRNHSSESRASSGRARADRGNTEGVSDDKRSDRDARDHSGPTRRDSLTHSRSDRGARERATTGDGDRDKDKDRDSRRDRHGDRERDRDRDRDREKDRDRERDRDRDRDRDRHGDRHRRDEKERESRKDRDASSRGQAIGSGGPSAPTDDRAPPSRPDPSRHRNGADDGLGKRRRGLEEESDRGTKRSSRKDGKDSKDTHREDRSRRPGDKSEHDRNRDSDRRRRTDRDADSEGRGQSSEKGEKRLPDGPLGSGSKVLPASTPSAPRAMSTSDTSRSGKAESGAGRSHREHSNHNGLTGSNAVPLDGGGLGSLRSRIGDKEPRTQGTPQSYPPSSRKDEREPKKRGFGERDNESTDKQQPPPVESLPPPKRPRLNRNRYPTGLGEGPHAIAKKLLPINPQAGDKLQGRKD